MGADARKKEFLEDLNEFGSYMALIAEYADKALQVLVKRTHILNGDGITDIAKIRDRADGYAGACEEIAADIKGGKISKRMI